MKKDIKPLARREKLVMQSLDDETLVYDLETNRVFCLNQTSSLVWEKCNGNNTVSEISGFLTKQSKSSVSEDFVWLALEQLKKENLLDEKEEISNKFEHLSRRDVVRRIGLASVIALPLISSVVAPSSISAASCLAIDAICTASAQCCSACCKAGGGGVNQCKPGGGSCLP